MNYEMLKFAKKALSDVTDLCETLQDKGWIDLSSSLRMKDLLLHDISEYILYIIAADGSINIHEVEVFRYITEYGGDTVSSLKEYIEEKSDVQSYSFQSEPPFSLRLLVDATNSYLRANPEADDAIRCAYEQYIILFGVVGKETMESDHSVPYSERNKYVTYLSTIKQFIEEHSYVTPGKQALKLLESL